MGTVSGTLLFSQIFQNLMEDPSMCQSYLQTQILIERCNQISGKGGKQQKRSKKKTSLVANTSVYINLSIICMC